MSMQIATETEIIANRELWIAALTSRKFRQHRGHLASNHYKSFCCLGVAAESVPGLGLLRGEDYTCGYFATDQQAMIYGQLGKYYALKLGLSDDMQIWLMDLNDERRVPLKVIGKVVRELPVVYDYREPFTGFEFEAENETVRIALESYSQRYE